MDEDQRWARLERRVDDLESELRRLRASLDTRGSVSAEKRPLAPPVALRPPTASEVGAMSSSLPSMSPMSPMSPGAHRSGSPVVDTETVLKWGGVVLVVLAIAFAVSTAIARGWIGPELQLAGAVAFGVGLVVLGLRLQPSRPRWTPALCGAGVVALHVTFASSLFLDQVDARVALALTLVVAGGGMVVARRIAVEGVAVATLVAAAIGTAVIEPSDPGFVVTVSCAGIVALAAVLFGTVQRWYVLRLAAQLIAAAVGLVAAVTASGSAENVAAAVVAAATAASLVRSPSLGAPEPLARQLEVQAAALAAPWAFLVVVGVAEIDDRRGPVAWSAFAVAGVAGIVAVALRRWNIHSHTVSLVVGASIVASIGFAALLDAPGAFLALSVQGAGLVVLARTMDAQRRVQLNGVVLLAIAGTGVLAGSLDAWNTDAPLVDDLVRLAALGVLVVGLWQLRERAALTIGAVTMIVLVMVWLGSVLGHLPQGQAIVSASWAIVGVAVLLVGVARKVPEAGTVGLVVLGVTVGKLLTVDLQEVDTLWRAGLFLVIGLGLMRLGFVLPRLTAAGRPASELDADVEAE